MSITKELAARNGGHRKDTALYRRLVAAAMNKRVRGPAGEWEPAEPSEQEVDQFLLEAAVYGLEPLAGQIYASWETGVIEAVPTIDGLRRMAERTGEYGGQSSVEWCDSDGTWRDVWLGAGMPAAALAAVHRKGHDVPTVGTVMWSEFAPQDTSGESAWNPEGGRPAHMLSIRAEALALRKAFPVELGGLYTAEELGLGAAEPDPRPAETPPPPPAASAAAEGGPSSIVDPPEEQPHGAPALPARQRSLADALEAGEYGKLRFDLAAVLFEQHPERLTDEQAEQMTAILREADAAGITAMQMEHLCNVGRGQEGLAARRQAFGEWIRERARKVEEAASGKTGAGEKVPEAPGDDPVSGDAAGPATLLDADPGPEGGR